MTKVQIVELAALIQTEHESDVLGGLMATGMQPVSTAYRDMTEATLDGVIVHVNAAIGKESFEGFSVIQDVIDCSMYHRSILGTRFTDLLQSVHDPVYYSLAPPLPERQPCFRTCIVFTLKHPLYVN